MSRVCSVRRAAIQGRVRRRGPGQGICGLQDRAGGIWDLVTGDSKCGTVGDFEGAPLDPPPTSTQSMRTGLISFTSKITTNERIGTWCVERVITCCAEIG